ncbi:hypothetical protein [Haloarcula sp. 1CSR25-25]|uniref:hypothetical protein n=1 Tax=Haloarcula sp. 1CSR25-25 TaxID=2862545 RepID=UPI002893BCF8|nr:hypothetical protein [Haloarcula sp. 1CSR25-25]MDT3435579.1 hypothetical protein [Haloarcula sp. 1CSR25-25]
MNLDSLLDGGDTGDDEPAREEVLTQLELLAEENKRLRDSYTRAKQSQYQRTAAGLALLGMLAIGSSVFAGGASDVLLILGGIGLFGGLLTYYITPEQFVAAEVGRDVYATLAGNEAAIVEELGLADTHLYVPTGADGSVRLFVPQHETAPLPATELLEQTIVVSDDGEARGVALDPSGYRLFRAVERSVTGSLAATPGARAEQLADAVVEQFELARTATPEMDPENNQLTVAVSGSAYGPLDRFDHPIASVFGLGLAHGLDVPVSVTVTEATDDRAASVLTCRWTENTDSEE